MRPSIPARAALTIAALLLSTTVALAATLAYDLTGKWDFEVVTENGTGTPAVTFKQEGEKLTGTYESRMLGLRSLEGTVKGDTVKFTLSSSGDANAITLTFVGLIVDKDNLKGSVDFAGMGNAAFTGTRKKSPAP